MGYFQNEEAAEYAKLICSVYPGRIKVKVAYTNSGSEANDTAIKFARAFTKRQKIIYFNNYIMVQLMALLVYLDVLLL